MYIIYIYYKNIIYHIYIKSIYILSQYITSCPLKTGLCPFKKLPFVEWSWDSFLVEVVWHPLQSMVWQFEDFMNIMAKNMDFSWLFWEIFSYAAIPQIPFNRGTFASQISLVSALSSEHVATTDSARSPWMPGPSQIKNDKNNWFFIFFDVLCNLCRKCCMLRPKKLFRCTEMFDD